MSRGLPFPGQASCPPEMEVGVTPAPEPIKIALVLSGAVALGSFEAGVVCELLKAVGEGAPLTVDVITGSSAGSLVGAITAKSLVTGMPFEPVLREWTEFTLQELTATYETPAQARKRGQPLDMGILSSEAVRRILENSLVNTPAQGGFQPRFAARRVVLSVPLTNLDGLPDVADPTREPRFAEAVLYRFTVPDPQHLDGSPYPPAVWKRLAKVGRGSSAFPGAFDPEYIAWKDRIRMPGLLEEEWVNNDLLERLHETDPGLQPQMRYADGGILDEHPVERTIAALPYVTGEPDEAGEETLVYDPRRCILLIEPDPPVTSLDALKAGTPQTWLETFSRGVRLWSLTGSPNTPQRRMITANKRQEKLFRFLTSLARSMREDRRVPSGLPGRTGFAPAGGTDTEGLIDARIYRQAVRSFYQWLADDRRFRQDLGWLDHLPPGRVRDVHGPVVAALLDLREAYIALEGVDPLSPGRYQAILEEVHAELAEDLGLSQPWVAMHQIAPDDPKLMLKGEGIAHFGGFFAKEFLEHDFEVGRYYAYLWLKDAVPGYAPADPPAKPPTAEDDLDWRLLWRNRVPLWRMNGRVLAIILETIGLTGAGGGQLLVRLLGWSLLLSSLHGLVVLLGAWVGWITFAPQHPSVRLWLLLGTSLFPLTSVLVLWLSIRAGAIRSALKRRQGRSER